MWTARATVYVHSAAHGAVSGATVTGSWSGGASGTASCVTDRRGRCTITSAKLPLALASATFTVSGVSRSGQAYDAAANHDPDGSSDGTAIVIAR